MKECPLCYFPYTNERKPKIFSCGHTMCEICIKDMIKNATVSCPFCSAKFTNVNVDKLTINFELISKRPIKDISVNKTFNGTIYKETEVADQIRYLNMP